LNSERLFLKKWWKAKLVTQNLFIKFSQWGFVVWLYSAFNKIYDYVIYTAVIAKFGIILGGTIMMVASFFLDLITLRLYHQKKSDIFGLEAIKALRDAEPKSFGERLTKWGLQKSRGILFLVLSLISNPFVVTAYPGQRTEQFDGMHGRDWVIFLSSFLLGQLFWILAITGIIKLFQEYISYFLT
jgi:hypothetical protein